MCRLSDIVTEWQPFGRSKPLRALFALNKLFCFKEVAPDFQGPVDADETGFRAAIEVYQKKERISDLPHALFRCVIHDGPMSGEFKKMEHLAPNEALKSYHLTCVGMRREFLRLWTNFSGGEPPEDIAWNSATALAWVYPEGIRLVKDRDYYCYGL